MSLDDETYVVLVSLGPRTIEQFCEETKTPKKDLEEAMPLLVRAGLMRKCSGDRYEISIPLTIGDEDAQYG